MMLFQANRRQTANTLNVNAGRCSSGVAIGHAPARLPTLSHEAVVVPDDHVDGIAALERSGPAANVIVPMVARDA